MKQRLRWLSAPTFAAAAAFVIGHALRISNGMYDSSALIWLTIGFALGWLAILSGRWSPTFLTISVCVIGLLWQIRQDMTDAPMDDCTNPYVWFLFGAVAIPVFAVTVIGSVLLARFARRIFIPLLLATYFISGIVLLRTSKPPFIDVYEISELACQAISHGISPYATTLPAGRRDPSWYPAGSTVNGRIQYGYPYTPLDLAVEYPGYLLAGDLRFGLLLSMTIAGALLAYSAPGPLPAAAVGILLLSPKNYFCVQQAWVDPISICALAAVVFCANRKPKWIGIALGLLLASKQDMILALPAALLLLPRPVRWGDAIRLCGCALAVAMLITLPIFLWNPQAFWHSAIQRHLASSFRADSLNFAAWWVNNGHAQPPIGVAFAAAAVAMLALFRAPRTPAGFALGVAVIYLCFFGAANQAFCNYYVFVIGALCSALAANSRAIGTQMPMN